MQIATLTLAKAVVVRGEYGVSAWYVANAPDITVLCVSPPVAVHIPGSVRSSRASLLANDSACEFTTRMLEIGLATATIKPMTRERFDLPSCCNTCDQKCVVSNPEAIEVNEPDGVNKIIIVFFVFFRTIAYKIMYDYYVSHMSKIRKKSTTQWGTSN